MLKIIKSGPSSLHLCCKIKTFLKSGIVLIFLCSFQTTTSFKAQVSEDRIQLALRRTADRLLRISGDDSSRIEILRGPDSSAWWIQIEAGINYDSLPELLQSSLQLHGLHTPYSVLIRRCDNHQIDLGYHQFDLWNQESTPCAGRTLTPACRYIEIQFQSVHQNSWFSPATAGISGLLFLSAGLITVWMYRRKISNPKITSTGNPENLILLGSSYFDPEEMILVFQNQQQKLTFREAKLLSLFASNKQKLLERDFIMKEVWEDEGVLVGRSLDMFVSRLRKKLSADTSIRINAVHGIGYRMELEG